MQLSIANSKSLLLDILKTSILEPSSAGFKKSSLNGILDFSKISIVFKIDWSGAFNLSSQLDVNVTKREKKIDENAAAFILQGAIDFLNN